MRTILNIGHRKARGRPLTMFFSTVFLCAMLITPASISYAGTTIGDKDGVEWEFCTYKLKDGAKIRVHAG